jgi:hypothetical protein
MNVPLPIFFCCATMLATVSAQAQGTFQNLAIFFASLACPAKAWRRRALLCGCLFVFNPADCSIMLPLENPLARHRKSVSMPHRK